MYKGQHKQLTPAVKSDGCCRDPLLGKVSFDAQNWGKSGGDSQNFAAPANLPPSAKRQFGIYHFSTDLQIELSSNGFCSKPTVILKVSTVKDYQEFAHEKFDPHEMMINSSEGRKSWNIGVISIHM